ncbi:heterokaryon incompatibility protein-domain-containing protein [Lophiotrema nucula]|uniref:Heterokaryon incompatibility protein-domain-containing protein n=1 Tax=Lophiotrema nucula TaxID=690887 RepID=A0A6A5YWX6_9PLEO|nr:heterokaryon incompatibility protein-domain-containing protein [Lophiotrema nucula]
MLPKVNQDAAKADLECDLIRRWDDTGVNDVVVVNTLCPACEKLATALCQLSNQETSELGQHGEALQEHLYRCSSLATAVPRNHDLFQHHRTMGGLQDSYLSGCHLCAILWELIRSFRRNYEEKLNKDGIGGMANAAIAYKFERPTDDALQISMRAEISLPLKDGKWFNLISIPGTPAAVRWRKGDHSGLSIYPGLIFFNPTVDHHPAQEAVTTASEASLELARQWLKTCSEQHSSCRQVADGGPWRLPRRFLDVSDKRLRICDSAQVSQKPQYIALSHCWGNRPIIRLLQLNREDMYRHVDFKDLSKTFQDAVIITRRLGYSLLWIDSLCIIQDSEEDWAQESVIMGDVYRNSICTISALGASDGSEGCFVARNPLCYRPCLLGTIGDIEIYWHTAGVPSREWGDLNEKSRYSFETRAERSDYSVGVLHRRAWVFQERVLSPRTLHFGKRSIAWQCLEREATERDPCGTTSGEMSDTTLSSHTKSLWDLRAINFEATNVEYRLEIFQELWSQLRSAYTSCSLTFEKDRLIAVHGLMSIMQRRTGLTPIAGHWKENLLQDLLWYSIVEPIIERSTLKKPTWSWISFEGATGAFSVGRKLTEAGENFMAIDQMVELEFERTWVSAVVDVRAEPVLVEGRWNGQFRSALLTLRGRLRRVELEVLEAMTFSSNHRSRIGCNTNDLAYISPPMEANTHIFALPFVELHGCRARPEALYEFGLILERSSETEDGRWLRIGSYRKRTHSGETGPFFQYELGTEHDLILE